ncbi:MAG: hypothetical protein IJS60_01845 [Abditibacteriota bacterium]|nr:hypothetical protein [Abditibacteriota bacterium]
MKKVLFVFLMVLVAMSCFGAKLIESGDGLIFITSMSRDDEKIGDFKNITPNGITDGVIFKFSYDTSLYKTANIGSKDKETTFWGACEGEYGDTYVVATQIGEDDPNYRGRGQEDILVARFDENLNCLNYETAGTKNIDCAYDIIFTKDKRVVICGRKGTLDQSRGLVMSFNNELKDQKPFTYAGSFVKENDAEWTEFERIIETKDGNFFVVGYTTDKLNEDGVSKAIVFLLDKNFNVLKKNTYGGNGTDLKFSGVIEKPEGGFILVGYNDYGMDQKGCVMEIDKNLNKINYYAYMPVVKGKKVRFNNLNSIQPFQGNTGGYLIFGDCGDTETTSYYVLYNKGVFSEFCDLPERDFMFPIACRGDQLFILSRNFQKGKVTLEEIGWF